MRDHFTSKIESKYLYPFLRVLTIYHVLCHRCEMGYFCPYTQINNNHIVEGHKTHVDHCVHVFIASNFSIVLYMATNYRHGCAIPPRRTIRHVQVPIYAALLYLRAAACIRVLIHRLHCGFKDQLTPCDTLPSLYILE